MTGRKENFLKKSFLAVSLIVLLMLMQVFSSFTTMGAEKQLGKERSGLELLISEFAPAGGGFGGEDWVELLITNGSGDISGYILTTFDAQNKDEPLANSSVTVNTGDYIIVHYNESVPDETDATGDVDGSGFIDIYIGSSDLSSTNEQVALYTSNDYSEPVDAICWSNGDLSQSEANDAQELVNAGMWPSNSASSMADSSYIEEGASIARKEGKADTNIKDDWYLEPQASPGKKNKYFNFSGEVLITNAFIAKSPRIFTMEVISGGGDISCLVLSDLDLLRNFIADEPITLSEGDVFKLHYGEGINETDVVGDKNGDRIWDLYTPDTSPTGTTDAVALFAGWDILDAVAWCKDGMISSSEEADLDFLMGEEAWDGNTSENCVNISEMGADNELVRVTPYEDTNSKHDWYLSIPNTWQIETVDSSGNVSRCNSIAVDSSGHPHISYRDYSNRDLKYSVYNGQEWSIETVDSDSSVGSDNSIAVSQDDHPHIAYYDYSNKDLKYATWNGIEWEIITVDSLGDVGLNPSIVIDSNNHPHICYLTGWPDYYLKYAYFDGINWHYEMLRSQLKCYNPSIAIDSQDNPHISYKAEVDNSLIYTYYDGILWHNETVINEVGYWEDSGSKTIDLDDNNHPNICYAGYDGWPYYSLQYAHWNGLSWTNDTLELSENGWGYYSSLAIDAYGKVHISYTDSWNDYLKYAHKIRDSGVANITVPSAPKNLQAHLNNGSVNLIWEAPISDGGSAITGYRIYGGSSYAGETLLTYVDSSMTTYTDTTITVGQTYYYYVTAVNDVGESEASNNTSITYLDNLESHIYHLYGWGGEPTTPGLKNSKPDNDPRNLVFLWKEDYVDFILNLRGKYYDKDLENRVLLSMNSMEESGKKVHIQLLFDYDYDSEMDAVVYFPSYTTKGSYSVENFTFYPTNHSGTFQHFQELETDENIDNVSSGNVILRLWRSDNLDEKVILYCGGYNRSSYISIAYNETNATIDSDIDSDSDGIEDQKELELAETYKPHIFLDSNELTYPTTMKYALDYSELRNAENQKVLPAPLTINQLLNFTSEDYKDFYLDNLEANVEFGHFADAEKIEKHFNEKKDSYPPTTYVNVDKVNEEGNDYYIIQYWLYYPVNNWLNDHEGDWEMVQVVLDKDEKLYGLGYSQHYGGQKVIFDTIPSNTHPEVYAAKGSHASYFRPRVWYKTDSTNGKQEIKIDNLICQVILGNEPWLKFRGHWGQASSIHGWNGPEGPCFRESSKEINIWNEPMKWFRSLSDENDDVVILDCPANLTITDKEGRKLGYVNGNLVDEIPGGNIICLGETEIYSLPPNKEYSFTIGGYGEGDYNISLFRNILGDERSITISSSVAQETKDILEIDSSWIDVDFSTEDENKTYDIHLTYIGVGETREQILTGISIEKDSSHSYNIENWELLGEEASVELTIQNVYGQDEDTAFYITSGMNGEDVQNTIKKINTDVSLGLITIEPKYPKDGDKVTIKVNISNNGLTDITGLLVRIYIDETLIGDKAISLSNNSNNIIELITWNAIAGNHSLRVILDEDGLIDEIIEDNNEAILFIEVSEKEESLGFLIGISLYISLKTVIVIIVIIVTIVLILLKKKKKSESKTKVKARGEERRVITESKEEKQKEMIEDWSPQKGEYENEDWSDIKEEEQEIDDWSDIKGV